MHDHTEQNNHNPGRALSRLPGNLTAFLILALLTPTGFSYTTYPSDVSWPNRRATFHVGIPGTSPSGVSWAEAMEQAVQAWSAAAGLQLEVAGYGDPCGDSSTNGAAIASTICGSAFGASTVAITVLDFQNTPSDGWHIAEADIHFNSSFTFDVYDGPRRPGVTDFRRVALHELGHALGLGHETSAPAIMAPMLGNIDRLQPDDLAGIAHLYGSQPPADQPPPASRVRPQAAIIGGNRSLPDTDARPGELVNLAASISAVPGVCIGSAAQCQLQIVSRQWLVGGRHLASGQQASIRLNDGSNRVSFRAVDSSGASSTDSVNIVVLPPLQEGWLFPYNGVMPDPALQLPFNNIGLIASDGQIHSCVRVETRGRPDTLDGVPTFDVILEILSLEPGLVRVVRLRPFNPLQLPLPSGSAPDCSGVYETTTGQYTDTVQVDESVLRARFVISDDVALEFRLLDLVEL